MDQALPFVPVACYALLLAGVMRSISNLGGKK